MTNQYESNLALGQTVKDIDTGLTGKVVCVAFWRYGCTRVGLQPIELDEHGNIREVVHLDEPQLVAIDEVADKPTKKAHGPRQDSRR